jgi:hypothetical protein
MGRQAASPLLTKPGGIEGRNGAAGYRRQI